MASGNKQISKAQATKRINALSKELEHHSYLYYLKNSPEISDYVFDFKSPDSKRFYYL